MKFLYILAVVGIIAILVLVDKKLATSKMEKNGKRLIDSHKVNITINVNDEVNRINLLKKREQDKERLSLLYNNSSTLCIGYTLIKYKRFSSSSDSYLTHEIYGEEIILSDFSLLPFLPTTAVFEAHINGSEIYTELRRDDTKIVNYKTFEKSTKSTFYKVPLGYEIKIYSFNDRGKVVFIFMHLINN